MSQSRASDPHHAPEPAKRVVVAGGGIAGMEAALALADLAGDKAELSLVSRDREFVYRPLTVEEPFTNQRARCQVRPRPALPGRPRGPYADSRYADRAPL